LHTFQFASYNEAKRQQRPRLGSSNPILVHILFEEIEAEKHPNLFPPEGGQPVTDLSIY
jgi:hypothetical protein